MQLVVFCGREPRTCAIVSCLESVYRRNIRMHSSMLHPISDFLKATFNFVKISAKKLQANYCSLSEAMVLIKTLFNHFSK